MPADLDGISFRPAEERDLPAMIDVGRKAFLYAFWELSPIEVIRDWVTKDFEGRHYPELWPRIRLAVAGDRPIGLIGVEGNYVDGLWIHPNYHRRGIGTKLMRDAETNALDQGHTTMSVEYSEFNAGASRFYLAIGYREVSDRTEMLTTGIAERLIRLEKPLSDR